MIEADDRVRMVEYLVGEIEKLAAAGAECGLLAANTPHIVFDEIRRQASIPMVSIVEATRDAAKALGLKRLGLFGTRFTMLGDFYPRVFSAAQIELAVPKADEQTYIHDRYMNELVKGAILAETRRGLLAIVDRMKEQERIEGLILGGTELPLILGDVTDQGIPFLDTTKIHVEAAGASSRRISGKGVVKSGDVKGTVRSDLPCLSVSERVRRHRLISISYILLLPCHGRGRGFESRRPRHSFQKS